MKLDLNDIKELRNRTGAGISDCKKALEECGGGIDKAVDKLRVIGLAIADKKSDRVASDGLIAMRLIENCGALIKLKCENNFVARSERFMELISNLASLACKERCTSIDGLKGVKCEGVGTVERSMVRSYLKF